MGGSESALFAAELVRMYSRLAVRKGWKATLVESVGLPGVGMGTGDAYREAILEVAGEGAFGVLRKEAGVHRVQRVPATESQGRVHTSTVGIIVSPLPDHWGMSLSDVFVSGVAVRKWAGASRRRPF